MRGNDPLLDGAFGGSQPRGAVEMGYGPEEQRKAFAERRDIYNQVTEGDIQRNHIYGDIFSLNIMNSTLAGGAGNCSGRGAKSKQPWDTSKSGHRPRKA